MNRLLAPFKARYLTFTLLIVLTAMVVAFMWWNDDWNVWWWLRLGALLSLVGLGIYDLFQPHHSILRNYPVAGHIRFALERFRPEIRQYFLEADKDGMPFSRDKRAIVYQRAKKVLSQRPFGTLYGVYEEGYEWVRHSVMPSDVADANFRVWVGGPECEKPYSASVFNISAMSFGSLSANAIRSLNKGAALGGFAHDTGEGGVSRYHTEFGGDLIWEIGSGYFGARDDHGRFSPERFAAVSSSSQIKMVELKLSQGAKPGHGGVLPAAKVSAEIAATRGVPEGQACISPARHSTFATPIELLEFIEEMRRLSGGKPTGFKLCLGHRWEFLAICKAMVKTGRYPDFIVVDGKEGGTGAAPLEFMDHLGMPLREGLSFVHNALVGINARDRVRIGASGKIITAFDIARAMALGADWCNSARGFMFAVGCLQSLSCHTDHCPTGVATQDPERQRAIVVPDKAERVRNFHDETTRALAEFVAAAGLGHPGQFTPAHFSRRGLANEVLSLAETYPPLSPGALIEGTLDPRYMDSWAMADAHSFRPRDLD